MPQGLETKYYVDAQGRYLGGFAGVARTVRQQTGVRTRTERRPVFETVNVKVAVPDSDRVVIKTVPRRQPRVVTRPAVDEFDQPLGTVQVVEIEEVEVEDPVFEDQVEIIEPRVPRGAIEVATAPARADQIWRNGRWEDP